MTQRLRFLVCDAYPSDARSALRQAGAHVAGKLYERLLHALEPASQIDVIHPADADAALPPGVALRDYDGIVWTGSSLTIYHDDDSRVRRQLELARQTRAADLPSFGSCWAAQLATVIAGGRCAANPKGREFGISRRIELTASGRAHAMYRGKPAVFDAFTSHADEIVELAPRAELLASNAFSRVQAIADRAQFWAVQYHPEYDLFDVARLSVYRMDELIRQGTFRDRQHGHEYVQQLEALYADPQREDLRRALSLDATLLDPHLRTIEARNWIDTVVVARRH